MATLFEHPPMLPLIPSRPATPPPHASLNISRRDTPAAVPNKHIPLCPPGTDTVAPLSSSPPSSDTSPITPIVHSLCSESEHSAILSRPDQFVELQHDPPIYAIESSTLADAVEEQATMPLPEPERVFPWLHGMHPDNTYQMAFFASRSKSFRKQPHNLRSLTIVKAGGDLTVSRLKGAVAPSEILTSASLASSDPSDAEFIDPDPRQGFCVRNFHTQTAKLATISDIVIYADDETHADDVLLLATRIAYAQAAWKQCLINRGWDPQPSFHTFVVLSSFKIFEESCPNIVSIDSSRKWTCNVLDFSLTERIEMLVMTQTSEIAPNVFLGPTPDPSIPHLFPGTESPYDVAIEASDNAHFPGANTLCGLKWLLIDDSHISPVQLEVPPSGSISPPTWTHKEADGLLGLCKWIWDISSGDAWAGAKHDSESVNPSSNSLEDDVEILDATGHDDSTMSDCSVPSVSNSSISSNIQSNTKSDSRPRKVFIHCADGYTETTLLALTYMMYAFGLTVAEASIRLHRGLGRNFFAYQSDITLLTSIQPRILSESPALGSSLGGSRFSLSNPPRDPEWLKLLDGSLPSRILDYMYLGNLNHANNPELLKALGINRVLSIGEKVSWLENAGPGTPGSESVMSHGIECLTVSNVQDNGMDSLTNHFDRCLDFVERGLQDGMATLVHCRVGVSRSATITIAAVMKSHSLTFARAYCFVRARRLNVIIQPHLRFIYELLKWEETLCERKGKALRRDLDWSFVAREIAAMNKPYVR